jgi:hypothetical protein
VSDKPQKGTGLEKAVAELDAAFAALPAAARQGWALAAYRAYPMIKQYIIDVENVLPDGSVKRLNEAVWRLILSLVWVIPRGKDHTARKLGEALATRAPTLNRFVERLREACNSAPAALTDGERPDERDPEALPAATPRLLP